MFFGKKLRFAEVFNLMLPSGLKIDPAHLILADPEAAILIPAQDLRAIQKMGDLAMLYEYAWGSSIYRLLLRLEIQMMIHYGMPSRKLIYASADLDQQMKKIRDAVKEAWKATKKNGMTEEEYFSGIRKMDKIDATILGVIYLGPRPWDAPKTYHEMLNLGGDFLQVVDDSHYLLLDPHQLPDEVLDSCQTDVGIVLRACKASGDREKLENLIREDDRYHNLDKETLQVLEVVLNRKLKRYQTEKGGYNMCKALDEMCRAAQDKVRKEMAEQVEEKSKVISQLEERNTQLEDRNTQLNEQIVRYDRQRQEERRRLVQSMHRNGYGLDAIQSLLGLPYRKIWRMVTA